MGMERTAKVQLVEMGRGVASTDGSGLWSNAAVQRIPIRLVAVLSDSDFAHIRAYFPRAKWSENTMGLIYTDKRFLVDVKMALRKLGYRNVEDLDYSEQGMQGDDYVDFDVGKKLTEEIKAKLGFTASSKVAGAKTEGQRRKILSMIDDLGTELVGLREWMRQEGAERAGDVAWLKLRGSLNELEQQVRKL